MTYDKKAPFKGKLEKVTSISFECDCLPKKYRSKCDKLTVYNLLDGDMEVGGVFLKPKQIDRLVKFLLRAKVAKMTIKKHRHIAGNSGKCIICSK